MLTPGWLKKGGKELLVAQASDLGIIPIDSLPFSLPYNQSGILETSSSTSQA